MASPYQSDRDWEKYGQRDPYYGVLSTPEYRRENLDEETLARFFHSGQLHVARVMETAERHFGNTFRSGAALDFGCGVGRLVLPLAENFPRVVGVDISNSMLTEAERNCRNRGVANVEFVLSDDDLSRVSGEYSFVHSTIVLQHIPVQRGERIIEMLIGKLAPGGVAALEMPVARDLARMERYRLLRRFAWLRESINWARRTLPPVHMLANLLQGRPLTDPVMLMNQYDLGRLLVICMRNGIGSAFIETTNHDGQIGVFLYFRKD